MVSCYFGWFHPNFANFNVFVERYLENFMFLPFISLVILAISIRHLKFPVISIQNLIKLNYSQLLIEKRCQHEILNNYFSQEKTTYFNILIGDLIIQKGASKTKKLTLTHLVRHSASAFGFHKKIGFSL